MESKRIVDFENDYKRIVYNQKNFFKLGKTLDLDFRIKKLRELKECIKNNENEILEALNKDLNKSEVEGYLTEVGLVYDEINIHIKKLKQWAKPERRRTPLTQFKSSSYIYREPYGTTLIIGPFNYPFQLVILPLIGAISAGNTAVIKPSEYSINTTKVLIKIIEEVFNEEYVKIVAPFDGKEEVSKILELKFDYIFFTGSVPVGKIIMESASKNLTPVTLELGGKSPCIVDKDCKIEVAARRIVWGKLINAGQTCVAPDYIYVHKDIESKFLELLKKEIKNQYGDDTLKSPDYPRIINERHLNRIAGYINKNKIYYGGRVIKEERYIEPTILKDVTWEDDVMKDEIFGPIFPILSYDNLDDVLRVINDNEKPLALYYFSEDKRKIDKVLRYSTSGGVTINDTIVHVASPYIPFGGVGSSGMGSYHGKESFLTFSHSKSIMKRATWIDLSVKYAPFNGKINLIKKLMK